MLNFENLDKANFLGVGKYDMPIIQPEHIDVRHLEWIPFNFAKTCTDCATKGVHFFVDDINSKGCGISRTSTFRCCANLALCVRLISQCIRICRLLCRYTITIASTGWRHTGSNAGFTLCQPYVGAMNKATSGALMASRNIRLWRFPAWERRKASRIKRCLKKAFGRHWQGLNQVRFCGMANARKNLTGTSRRFNHIISE